MWPRIQSMLIFFLLVVLYLGVIYLVQNRIPSARLDLTENKLFTLSQGSERIIKNIKTPIELNLYYSEKEARPYPQFRQYAERVIEKIEEYAELSGKKILFKQIDPEPYSVAEDLAIANGILAVPLEDGSGPLYFGLTAKSGKMLQSIGFIKPESEQNLEYELSKLMQSVQVNTKRKVALVSELPIAGNANPSMGPVSSAWVIYRQLSERFDVQVLNPQGLEIPADIGVLWVVHPKNWPKSTLKQIQDYVESGRHAVFMLDPYAESVPAMSVFEQALGSGFSESDMPALLSRWGIGYDPSQDRKSVV